MTDQSNPTPDLKAAARLLACQFLPSNRLSAVKRRRRNLVGGRRRTILWLAIPVLAAGLTGLAGCDSGPEPVWTPSPPPTVKRTPAPAASPATTELVWAPDDPSWSADQLAAAHIVDAYIQVRGELLADPPNADTHRLLDITTATQYSEDLRLIAGFIQADWHFEFSDGTYIIPVARTVSEERTVNGIRQIKISQCDADNPTGLVVDPNGSQPPPGPSRVQYVYTVQWVEAAAGWRVAACDQPQGMELPC
ncbi:MAG: hypothetical protein LBI84_02835 [Propionibacteriaceae bacterium]|jgi:hypothetical protein|nr:hypothetical protein [Propionibacteriaceae bacterium]